MPMLDQSKMRKADFITSIILFLFSLWMMAESFRMPMSDSFGGVQNVWYVSPAFFPLSIALMLLLLSVVLFLHSLKVLGATGVASLFRKTADRISHGGSLADSSIRFVSILLSIITFVYILIPRVDFFLAIMLFLLAFITPFYYDDNTLLRRLLAVYAAGMLLFVLYFAFRLDAAAVRAFKYMTDVFALLFIVVYAVIARKSAGADRPRRKKFWISLSVSFVIPLFLVPVFRYFLLVPLPREGGIIGIMHLIRYGLF